MTSTDISRSANDPAKRYTSVRMQQGRVIVDDDWNEAERITQHERVESLVDVIGPSGTSDDALRLSNVTTAGGQVDFDLGEGTIYVAGRRLRVPPGQRYLLQDDFFSPPSIPVPGAARNDLVWVEVTEVAVTAIEDAELREVGLGGPDTSARTRLVARVLVETDVEPDCELAWESTVGADVDDRGVLATDAEMVVGFVPDLPPEDLCTPDVAGGYLSHRNQAIRVQAINDTEFTWGFDNASALYRVDLAADRQTVHFRNTPVDEAHRPRAGQVVELLPWSAVLANGQLQAAEVGAFATVGESYDPDLDQLVLAAAMPSFGELDWLGRPDASDLEADGRYVFLRVWDRGADASPPALAQNPGAAVPLGSTGLSVTFSGQVGRGDHWIIAARPAEPTRVVPWDFLTGRPPHGPVRLRAPLGLLLWDDSGRVVIEDCRRRFRPLTELQGCCEISVGDGSRSFGDVESIQQAVDLLPPRGGRVCVQPGLYRERVVIQDRTFVEIVGCGPDTVIAPDTGSGPVFDIDGSNRVKLASMRINGDAGEGVLVGARNRCRDVRLEELAVVTVPTNPGIRVTSPDPGREPTVDLRIDRCRVAVADLAAPPAEGTAIELWPAIWIQGQSMSVEHCEVRSGLSKLTGGLGGIQVAGMSTDVELRDNVIVGGNGHGITLGSIYWVPDESVELATSDLAAFNQVTVTLGWYVWFDDGCIQVGGWPGGPDGGGDVDRIPLSAGPVRNVVIADNEIGQMAAEGIAAAWFFDPAEDERADIITVEVVLIEGNEILGNRRTTPPPVSPTQARFTGFGGVALASVRDLRVARNRIFGNGVSENDPICGFFVLRGEALQFVGNDIVDNGPSPDGETPPRLGNRGGIVIKACQDLTLDDGPGRPNRSVGALMIEGNRIAQPAGQAIWVVGKGRMLVHDNQLSAGGLGLIQLINAVIRFLDSNLDDWADIAVLAARHLVGSAVFIVNTGLPFDVARALDRSKVEGGPNGLNKLNQVVRDVSSPIGRSSYESAMNTESRTRSGASGQFQLRNDSDYIQSLVIGGHISFNDNQVALDLLEAEVSIALCSVLLLTLDDVAIESNQVRCLTHRDLVLVDVAAAGFTSTRCQGNRIQDSIPLREQGQGGVFLSGMTWSLRNVTTGNITTMPLVANAPDPTNNLVDEHNLRLV